MSQKALNRGDWQAVINAHLPETKDPDEWLRYVNALLHSLQPGPDVGQQQQQADLAFVQAQRESASQGAVVAAQRQVMMPNLFKALELPGVPAPSQRSVPTQLRRVLLVPGRPRRFQMSSNSWRPMRCWNLNPCSSSCQLMLRSLRWRKKNLAALPLMNQSNILTTYPRPMMPDKYKWLTSYLPIDRLQKIA